MTDKLTSVDPKLLTQLEKGFKGYVGTMEKEEELDRLPEWQPKNHLAAAFCLLAVQNKDTAWFSLLNHEGRPRGEMMYVGFDLDEEPFVVDIPREPWAKMLHTNITLFDKAPYPVNVEDKWKRLDRMCMSAFGENPFISTKSS